MSTTASIDTRSAAMMVPGMTAVVLMTAPTIANTAGEDATTRTGPTTIFIFG